jgi:cytochrome c oxidase assembly protein subunit 15
MNTTDFNSHNQRLIGVWLLICCALIYAMVVLGGVTRLTGSGLSMVEWEPLVGVVPPLTDADWQETFTQYQQSPEYQKINVGMDLEGFKSIFRLEYLHRLLGRLIGAVFLLPLLFFLITRKLPCTLIPKLVIVFVLGGLQGLLGWYMVKSGLVDNPHVSHYRLTAHLMFAVLLYGYLLWVALGLLSSSVGSSIQDSSRTLRRLTYGLAGLVLVTLASGGLVAGLKAGFAYNTFPLMAGRWIPEGLFKLQPWPINLVNNAMTVQFDHRVLATLVFGVIVCLWFIARRYQFPKRLRYGVHALLAVGVLQVSLGISTLLFHVPVFLAASHQAGALLVFTAVLFLAHQLRTTGMQHAAA